MSFLIGAVVLVGLLCTLDLILTLGVIKRLREHGEQLAARTEGAAPPALGVGEEVGRFTSVTVEGERVDRELLDDETLVAFFSPNCTPCREKLPAFLAHARERSGGRRRVLAVVAGNAEGGERFVEALGPVALVVREDYDGPVGAAFKAQAYPTLLLVAPDAAGRLVVTADQVRLNPLPLTA
ncbi:TlpA disulfide reductase family protein [Streptomyces sp. NPDC057418]|uniref:TlpA disulfide reductase family protein n=1 Tax=unclassified Streptomyces TaxID=2593676 RepID=UPI00368AFAB6